MADVQADSDLSAKYFEYAADTTSFSGASRFLKFCRSTRLGSAATIAAVGSAARKQFQSSLGDEFWLVLEQTLIAALAVGDVTEAKACFDLLQKRFGKSARVTRLKGMVMEAAGAFGQATDLYTSSLKEHDTNITFIKRQVAIHKERNELPEAIVALSKCLETFSGDADSWLEMAELKVCLATGTPVSHVAASAGSSASSSAVTAATVKDRETYDMRMRQAIFCMEELLLLQPNNAAFHARVSELICAVCSEGGNAVVWTSEKDLRSARLHASESVRLTNKQSAYALTALADASYLHYCSVSRSPVVAGAKLLSGLPLSRVASIAANASAGAAAPGKSAASTAAAGASTYQMSEDEKTLAQEAKALHALAAAHLRALASDGYGVSVAAQARADVAVPGAGAPVVVKGGDALPALAVEAHLLASSSLAALEKQAEKMNAAGAS